LEGGKKKEKLKLLISPSDSVNTPVHVEESLDCKIYNGHTGLSWNTIQATPDI
jgi:hypothetical protein